MPMEGVDLEVAEFTPQFQKHAGECCRGIHIRVKNRSVFQPYRLGITLLIAAAKTFPGQFQWRKEAYEFIESVPAIDLLYGNDSLRKVAEGKSSIEEIQTQMETFENWFNSARKPYLLY